MAAPLRSPRDSFEVADPGLEIWIDDDPVPAVPPQSVLRWRFGGKEIAGQKVGASMPQNGTPGAPAGTPAAAAGRPYLDFGARLYDPRTAAWLAPDPLSEKYYPVSPYAYCAGNPVNLVDPDGKNPFLLGVISGAADFGLQIGVYMLNGASFNDAFKQVDWTSVAASAAIGAVNPSTTVRKIATALAITAIDAAADYTEDKGWEIIGQQGKDRKDIGDAAIDFATGAISGSAGSLIPDKIASGLSKEASNRSIMAPLTAAEKAEKRAIAHTANNEYVKEAEGLLLESFIQGTKQSLRIDFNEKTKENENKEYQVKFGTWR